MLASPRYRHILRGIGRSIASFNDRQYPVVAYGAGGGGHINIGVRCRNGGGAGGLYSQPGIITATAARITDGCVIGRQSDVRAEYARGRAVGGVDGIAACAGDTNRWLKVEAYWEVVGIVVDVGSKGTRAGSIAGDKN